jgi:hypothetical protein
LLGFRFGDDVAELVGDGCEFGSGLRRLTAFCSGSGARPNLGRSCERMEGLLSLMCTFRRLSGGCVMEGLGIVNETLGSRGPAQSEAR